MPPGSDERLWRRASLTLLSVQTVILLAAIPWAFRISGSVIKLETTIQYGFIQPAEWSSIKSRMAVCEQKIVALEKGND